MTSKFLNISTDTTLGGNSASDETVSSQKAIKAYVDNNSGSTYTAGTGIDITNDIISVTSNISTGAALGATAVQPSDLSTYVTTNTTQDITGRKTFLGEKAIYFKQSTSSNKLGFTLYNNNNKEVGALEFRPNSIGSTPILTLNSPSPLVPPGSSYGNSYVGFRYWNNSLNILAPFSNSLSNKNLFIPVTFTNGTTTVESTSTDGNVDISSLLPTKTSDLTNDSGYATESYVTTAIASKQDTISDLSTIRSGASAGATAVQPADLDTLLATLYPVGSIYIGTQSTCPLATLISGSTWALVATDKALWGGDGTNADTTIAAGLPNITGSFTDRKIENAGTPNGCIMHQAGVFSQVIDGASDTGQFKTTLTSGTGHTGNKTSFDASQSNAIYGASSTVQPPAYRVNVWRRTA